MEHIRINSSEPDRAGNIKVNWDCDNTVMWHQLLAFIKRLPSTARKYDRDNKWWRIAPEYIEPFYTFAKNVDAGKEEEFKDEELISSGSHIRDVTRLTGKMKKRATWVIMSLCDPESDNEYDYSVSRSEWGVYNQDDEQWWYDSGRYSSFSPSEWDQKAIQSEYDKLDYVRERSTAWPLFERNDFRDHMLTKYDNRCYICQQPHKRIKLHMHRVKPGRLGGEYTEDNVVILCLWCHKKAEGHDWDTVEAMRRSYEQKDLD